MIVLFILFWIFLGLGSFVMGSVVTWKLLTHIPRGYAVEVGHDGSYTLPWGVRAISPDGGCVSSYGRSGVCSTAWGAHYRGAKVARQDARKRRRHQQAGGIKRWEGKPVLDVELPEMPPSSLRRASIE